MLMTGNFTFISANSRDYQGKRYTSVNIDCDDEVLTIDAEESVTLGLEKYNNYCGIFKFAVFNGKNGTYSRLSLVAVKPAVNAEKASNGKA